MNFRIFMNIAMLIGSLFLCIGMIQSEIIQGKKTESNVTYQDQLRGLVYTVANRSDNLRAFGLDKKMVQQTLKQFERLEEDNDKRKITNLLRQGSSNTDVIEAFCGIKDKIRPRYAVAPFLIKEHNGRRSPIDIRRERVEFYEWASTVDIKLIYEMLELRQDPKPDSTKMFYGAIFLKDEDLLINRQSPWGEGVVSWKWTRVVRESVDKKIKLEEIMTQYFALMHFFIEVAQSPQGICEF